MMFRLLLFRLSRRRAVGTLIGGLIILTLILTALGMMVFVSQQYDQYQQSVNRMAQYQDQAGLENLVADSPGLTVNLGWTGCGGCNMYNMTLSNLGGVGVQIARIYINSTGPTGSGCSSPNPSPCVLNPSSTPLPTSFTFQQSAEFINAGEVNHAVLLYLETSPNNIVLPCCSGLQNMIYIVTSRGNVFSFQWPFQIQLGGQSQSAFSAGIIKVAYQTTVAGGYDSKNEPSFTGNPAGSGYCHTEQTQAYPAGAGYAEKLTGINYPNVDDTNTLYFVNPWITQAILLTASPENPVGSSPYNVTTLYLAVNITNTGTTSYTVAGGSLDLTWFGSTHIDGALIGYYYEPSTTAQFYPIGSTQTIAQSTSFLAIFRVTTLELDCSGKACETPPPASGSSWPPVMDVMMWGSAALTNNSENTFVGGVSLSSGLWIPVSCSG